MIQFILIIGTFNFLGKGSQLIQFIPIIGTFTFLGKGSQLLQFIPIIGRFNSLGKGSKLIQLILKQIDVLDTFPLIKSSPVIHRTFEDLSQ